MMLPPLIGAYQGCEQQESEVSMIAITSGYWRDHRADLKQWMLSLFGMVSPPARRDQHTQTCSFASHLGFPRLPDL